MDAKSASQKGLATQKGLVYGKQRWKEGHGPHFVLGAPYHALLLFLGIVLQQCVDEMPSTVPFAFLIQSILA